MKRDDLRERVGGCLLGLAVGGALGAPADGMTPYEVFCKLGALDGFHAWHGYAPGHYPASTQMALMTAASIKTEGGVGVAPMAAAFTAAMGRAKLSNWREDTITSLSGGDPIERADGEFLPRMIPVGLLAAARGLSDQQVVDSCRVVFGLTHVGKRVLLCGVILALVIREVIRNADEMSGPGELYERDESLLVRMTRFCRMVETRLPGGGWDAPSRRLHFTRRKLQACAGMDEFMGLVGGGDGAVDLMQSALFFFLKQPDDFRATMWAAGAGGAASLRASLVGGLCGAYAGHGSTPTAMRNEVENGERVQAMVEPLVDAMVGEEAGHVA